MNNNTWYTDYIQRLVNCPTCHKQIRNLYQGKLKGNPESLCYLPFKNVKLMFIAEAPGLGPKNDGLAQDKLQSIEWMNLDKQWRYISGQDSNFKTDSYGSFLFRVMERLKITGLVLGPEDIAVTNCIKYPVPRGLNPEKKLKIALSHQAEHLSEEFQNCRPKVVVALGSTSINTITSLKGSGKISFDSVIKLPHPSGSHPAGRWHYESYDLMDMLIQYLIKRLQK